MPTVEVQNISKLIDLPIDKAIFERVRQVNVGIDPDNIMVVLGVQRSNDF